MNNYKSGNSLPNIGIIGATGLVGRTFLKVIDERELPFNELSLFASARSAGMEVEFSGKTYIVKKADPSIFENLDIALFSAGGKTSKELAPFARAQKCIVIDNSSAWRMDTKVPLIVPEVNSHRISEHNYIIANPNCSTIQLVAGLKPLADNYGLKRVVCSTYQSISGAGQTGIDKLYRELEGNFDESRPIAYSTTFHTFEGEEGFTNEEIKMINETRKILEIQELPIAVTCVRVPTIGGHCESVNVELEKEFNISDIRKLLANTTGLVLMDDPSREIYATPNVVDDTDAVYISRLRRDDSVKNGLYLWIVADNIRKGAATNAVQIAEMIIGKS
ncbi:MAG: aspartate-semialdehyde dehydrogenase [Candidatus Kapabacteria bacterium]|nr:aspartate-semialdehyde dehydrogenase [Ignavibacteriota bacterium]MCW5883800.1 aspartate-semialdehyde dehydrogenase [Candidatus Kapabacteria bacterium]